MSSNLGLNSSKETSSKSNEKHKLGLFSFFKKPKESSIGKKNTREGGKGDYGSKKLKEDSENAYSYDSGEIPDSQGTKKKIIVRKNDYYGNSKKNKESPSALVYEDIKVDLDFSDVSNIVDLNKLPPGNSTPEESLKLKKNRLSNTTFESKETPDALDNLDKIPKITADGGLRKNDSNNSIMSLYSIQTQDTDAQEHFLNSKYLNEQKNSSDTVSNKVEEKNTFRSQDDPLWSVPESWSILPSNVKKKSSLTGFFVRDFSSSTETVDEDTVEDDGLMYFLRIYKEDSSFGTFNCKLSTTTSEILNMAGKKFFISDISLHCLLLTESDGLTRILKPNEKPAFIFKKTLLNLGYTDYDHIPKEGREDNSYVFKLSIIKAGISPTPLNPDESIIDPKVVNLEDKKLQTIPVPVYTNARLIEYLSVARNPDINLPSDFVQECVLLTELNLSGCLLTTIPTSLQYLPKLSKLYLNNNRLNSIPKVVTKFLTRLNMLVLRNNSISALPSEFARLSKLSVLDLSNNNIKTFPLVITNLPQLTFIDLSLNTITSIPDEISKLSNLCTLNMTANLLEGPLPDSLSKLINLNKVYLELNYLSDFSSISKLPKLRKAFLNKNSARSFSCGTSKAKFLSLGSNKLTNFILPISLQTLSKLDLSSNKLTELPKNIFNYTPRLEKLKLDNNLLVALPRCISELKILTYLTVSNNSLRNFPKELLSLPKLRYLSAERNKINSIPTEIWLMPKLAYLNLSSNLLESFPSPTKLIYSHVLKISSNSVGSAGVTASSIAQQIKSKRGKPGNIDGDTKINFIDNPKSIFHKDLFSGDADSLVSVSDSLTNQLPSNMTPGHDSAFTQNSHLYKDEHSAESPDGLDSNLQSSKNQGYSRGDHSNDDYNTDASGDSSLYSGRGSFDNKDSGSRNDTLPPLSYSLNELLISNNILEDDFLHICTYLDSLRVLNVSYNPIYEIPLASMSGMGKVRELYFSGTSISTIPEEDSNNRFWRQLRVLFLNNNNLQSLPSWFAKLSQLITLDVSCNQLKYNITNWQYDWNWNWNHDLQYLNFSHNPRLEIVGQRFVGHKLHENATAGNKPGFRSELDLKSNKQVLGPFSISTEYQDPSPDMSDFFKLKKLKMLGLLDITVMVPLPDDTPTRRIRTTEILKTVGYGIADTLGNNPFSVVRDMVHSKYFPTHKEFMFGIFNAQNFPNILGSVITKYITESFYKMFRNELSKIENEQSLKLENSKEQNPEPTNRNEAGTDKGTNDDTNKPHRSEASNGQNQDSLKGAKNKDSQRSLKTDNDPTKSSNANVNENTTYLRKNSEFSAENLRGISLINTTSMSDNISNALRRSFLELNKTLGTQMPNWQFSKSVYNYVNNTSQSEFIDIDLNKKYLESHQLNFEDDFDPLLDNFDFELYKNSNLFMGVSSVIAYLHKDNLYLANLGDCLAVLSRRGTPILLSVLHEVTNRDEIKRIQNLSGSIFPSRNLPSTKVLTRAFGSFGHLPVINSNPSIFSIEIGKDDEFVILGNNAFWDYVSYEQAVNIVKHSRRTPNETASQLRDFAIAYGSKEAIMVMVIKFLSQFKPADNKVTLSNTVRDSLVFSNTSGKQSQSSPKDGDSQTELMSKDSQKGVKFGHYSIDLDNLEDSVYQLDQLQIPESNKERRQRMKFGGKGKQTDLSTEIEPPVGEVALVFTDVKNSTAQWDSTPAAMREAITIHNDLMRRLLRIFGGYEVKTEGDAFMVSFASTTKALNWCLAVQTLFLKVDWPPEILDSVHGQPIFLDREEYLKLKEDYSKSLSQLEKTQLSPSFGDLADNFDGENMEDDSEFPMLIYRGLRIRMGIHLGTPVCEEDPITGRMDYFGPMVNRASRVSGAADGGQIFISHEVIEEVKAITELFKIASEQHIADMNQLINDNSLANDIQMLWNFGLGYQVIGERKLKGLETPEILAIVYPRSLRGRNYYKETSIAPVKVDSIKQIKSSEAKAEKQAIPDNIYPSPGENKGVNPDGSGLPGFVNKNGLSHTYGTTISRAHTYGGKIRPYKPKKPLPRGMRNINYQKLDESKNKQKEDLLTNNREHGINTYDSESDFLLQKPNKYPVPTENRLVKSYSADELNQRAYSSALESENCSKSDTALLKRSKTLGNDRKRVPKHKRALLKNRIAGESRPSFINTSKQLGTSKSSDSFFRIPLVKNSLAGKTNFNSKDALYSDQLKEMQLSNKLFSRINDPHRKQSEIGGDGADIMSRSSIKEANLKRYKSREMSLKNIKKGSLKSNDWTLPLRFSKHDIKGLETRRPSKHHAASNLRDHEKRFEFPINTKLTDFSTSTFPERGDNFPSTQNQNSRYLDTLCDDSLVPKPVSADDRIPTKLSYFNNLKPKLISRQFDTFIDGDRASKADITLYNNNNLSSLQINQKNMLYEEFFPNYRLSTLSKTVLNSISLPSDNTSLLSKITSLVLIVDKENNSSCISLLPSIYDQELNTDNQEKISAIEIDACLEYMNTLSYRAEFIASHALKCKLHSTQDDLKFGSFLDKFTLCQNFDSELFNRPPAVDLSSQPCYSNDSNISYDINRNGISKY
ncbi:hypothetical protein BB560_004006 [Smittium megazygosporum]|uniref:Adenylate cyclase n=2 Tax=Smittium megazygosporum TaxID=133381 RepID=A0A2T9ZAG1_9FUNG|nr:hypothetical protein BB560_004006 [Smittium megazygosporum]